MIVGANGIKRPNKIIVLNNKNPIVSKYTTFLSYLDKNQKTQTTKTYYVEKNTNWPDLPNDERGTWNITYNHIGVTGGSLLAIDTNPEADESQEAFVGYVTQGENNEIKWSQITLNSI